MKILNNKTISLLSFVPSKAAHSDYKLETINEDVSTKLKETCEKLEALPQVYLCARGDSFKTDSDHLNFINNNLSKIFVVGGKAKHHLENIKYAESCHYEKGKITDDDRKNEIKKLIIVIQFWFFQAHLLQSAYIQNLILNEAFFTEY